MLKSILLWFVDKLIVWLITSAWVTPATYTSGQLVTAADLNLVRDNLNALKAPPSDQYENFASSYTISGATFADVDATNLDLSITTTGGDVEITFSCVFTTSNEMAVSEYVAFDVLCDAARIGNATTGMIRTTDTNVRIGDCSMRYNKTGLSAGVHTFKLQAKETSVASVVTLASVFMLVRETT